MMPGRPGTLPYGALLLLLLLLLAGSCRTENTLEEEQDSFLSDEARLIRDLLKRYPRSKTLSRPVLNSSDIITVHFGLSLLQILDFDMKNQVLTTLLWKEYKWIDEVLRWNSSEYGGVDWVSLPGDSIWVPDIILYNNIDTRGQQVEDHKEKLVVYSNGSLYWIPPVIYRSSCPVQIANFPFDVQLCDLKFGSWSYATNRLNLEFLDGVQKFGTLGYIPNSEWEITGNSATRNVVKYSCCAEEYADLTFTIRMKRNSGFYLRVLLLPTLLLSFMVLIMFWIPPQRPDRTSLGMSLFASFMLLLLLVVQSSPPTTAAKIGTYCCLHIILISTGTMLSVLVVNLSGSKSPMPRLVKQIFLVYLGQYCCLCNFSGSKPTLRQPHKRRSHHASNPLDRQHETALLELTNCKNGAGGSLVSERGLTDSREQVEGVGGSGAGSVGVGVGVGAVCHKETHSEETCGARHARDWMMLANVLDRIFFFSYCILLILFLMFFFPLPSGEKEVSIFEQAGEGTQGS